ncbi:GTP pyrophosphokinase [Pseudomonas sp. PIC25]|uniref:GTP pyrophosphokinase n=1 Tax=Pseudomonas sp. PIC25 TaxID=1958773 RepID=UPI000BABC848|nr:GTP pyrophosphokinase [Pseudomonas sp. PIC25]PAU66561.1 GTP pyrophosphokinase [Pseudomonas sp. PIC25]
MSNIDKALEISCKTHSGQIDKGGEPYILHPLRLMLKFQDEESRIVAVLHDAIEDGEITTQHLEQAGFSEKIILAIECLTKKTGESYDDFLSRIIDNDLARRIKIEDIKDNLDITRLKTIDNKDLDRIKKYHNALARLQKST